jgi:hypothetical protein
MIKTLSLKAGLLLVVVQLSTQHRFGLVQLPLMLASRVYKVPLVLKARRARKARRAPLVFKVLPVLLVFKVFKVHRE